MGRRWEKMEVSLGPMREEARMTDITVNKRTARNPRRKQGKSARMFGKQAISTPVVVLMLPQIV